MGFSLPTLDPYVPYTPQFLAARARLQPYVQAAVAAQQAKADAAAASAAAAAKVEAERARRAQLRADARKPWADLLNIR